MANEPYQVSIVIPAGRRRYLEVLIPQILRQPGWHELQLWANTLNPEDLAYLAEAKALDSRIVISQPPLYRPHGSATIGQFFRGCVDPKRVYIRFDDDIVFLEPNVIERLAQFRWYNPAPFLVSPVVINSAIFSYLLKQCGRINTSANLRADCFDQSGWRSPQFAESLHRTFLEALRANRLTHFYLPDQPIAVSRFSINCISWLGSEFARFDGIVPAGVDEEEWLSVTKPSSEGRFNLVCGKAVVSHFAFFTQREHLDKTDLLMQYQDYVSDCRD